MSSKNKATLKSSTIRVGLTIGDPAGIGPAIALKALKALKGEAHFRVIGDSFVLDSAARALKIKSLPVELIDLNNIKRRNFCFGRVNALNGKASLDYLDAAVGLLKKKEIDCLVTCPVSKEAVTLAGPKFFGHTEYLADKFNCKDLVMMLVNDKLKFSLLTRHIPLKDVCRKITRNGLENNILNTIKGLKRLFLIRHPRIVVCGVNPHASDNGVIGTEELEIIKPAIFNSRNKQEDAVITGPLPADVAVYQAAKGNFDCVIALYHDQALIPLKLTDFDTGINLTLGLPFVRTSPLHGTAFDLAVNPALANPNSLIAAVKLAIKCTLNQKKA
ncbi:MAG: 4-hydroxythreonine-4-phosphate dehydrogenase PdxA [Candidatus Omnitrophota bacterium]|jgi:4-hydroxythreonine-4-phosphate dehydrogenase